MNSIGSQYVFVSLKSKLRSCQIFFMDYSDLLQRALQNCRIGSRRLTWDDFGIAITRAIEIMENLAKGGYIQDSSFEELKEGYQSLKKPGEFVFFRGIFFEITPIISGSRSIFISDVPKLQLGAVCDTIRSHFKPVNTYPLEAGVVVNFLTNEEAKQAVNTGFITVNDMTYHIAFLDATKVSFLKNERRFLTYKVDHEEHVLFQDLPEEMRDEGRLKEYIEYFTNSPVKLELFGTCARVYAESLYEVAKTPIPHRKTRPMVLPEMHINFCVKYPNLDVRSFLENTLEVLTDSLAQIGDPVGDIRIFSLNIPKYKLEAFMNKTAFYVVRGKYTALVRAHPRGRFSSIFSDNCGACVEHVIGSSPETFVASFSNLEMLENLGRTKLIPFGESTDQLPLPGRPAKVVLHCVNSFLT